MTAGSSLRIRRGALAVGLVLGIGAGLGATALHFAYSVVDRPLPYGEPSQLVALIQEGTLGSAISRWEAVTAQELDAWRGAVDLFQGVEAYSATRNVRQGGGTDVELRVGGFTSGLPDLLRIGPLVGRGFNGVPGEDLDSVAVVSEEYWRSRHAGTESIVGTKIDVGGQKREVIGVMPFAFRFLVDADVWIPASGSGLAAIARLREGVTIPQLRKGIDRRTASVSELGGNRVWLAESLQLLREARVPRQTVITTYAISALTLLVTIAGAAGIGMQQAGSHIDRLRIMAALGARRRDVVASILGHGILPLTVAIPSAIIVSILLSELLAVATPAAVRWQLFISFAPSTNWAVMGIAFVGCLVCWLAAMAVPLYATWRHGLRPAVGDTDRSNHGSSAPVIRSMGPTVQVAQIALATILVCASVVLANQYWRIVSDPWGYEPQGLSAVSVRPGKDLAADRTTRRIALDSMILSVRQSGLFHSVGEGSAPTSGATGRILVAGEQKGAVQLLTFGESYFPMVGMKSVAGSLDAIKPPTSGVCPVVVSQELSALLGASPMLGRRFNLLGRTEELEVAAVVASLRSPSSRGRPFVLMHEGCDSKLASSAILVRGLLASDVEILGTLQTLAGQHGFEVRSVRSVENENERMFELPFFYFRLALLVAVLSLLVTVSGVYSVTSEKVQRMHRVFWLWFALGGNVRSLSLEALRREGAALALGVIAGILVCYWIDARITLDLYQSSIRSPRLSAISLVVVGSLVSASIAIAYWKGWRRALGNTQAGSRWL